MKLSEAIKTLQAQKKNLGDVELFVRGIGPDQKPTKVPLSDITVLPGDIIELFTIAPDNDPPEPA